ncbi:MAG: hypothetical protein VYD19_09945 [Myxococcota bacterium]|nr:hypothetical protein [Myxococcota bacterium]
MSVEHALHRLQSGTYTEQLEAVEVLILAPEPRLLGAVTRVLERCTDARLMTRLCMLLGAFQDPRAIGPLLRASLSQEAEVESAAFSAILVIGAARAAGLPALEVALAADPQAHETRFDWQLDTEAIRQLDRALQSDDPRLRVAALYGQAALTYRGGLRAISERLYHDPDWSVRGAAAYALGELTLEHEYASLGEALIWSWWASEEALSRVDEAEALSALSDARLAILKGLAECLLEAATPVFEAGLSAAEARLRQMAILGLGRLGAASSDSSPFAHALSTVLGDREVSVRRSAAEAIGRLGERGVTAVLPALITALTGADPELRAAILSAAQQAPREVEVFVTERFSFAIEEEQVALCALAGSLRLQGLIEAAISSASPLLRKTGYLAISRGELTEWSGYLEQGLKDQDWRARIAAAEGLRRLGVGVEALRRAQKKEKHPNVRTAIERILQALS